MASRAFTLLEMLVVIAIIAIISVFAIPAVASIVNGSRLNQASLTLTGQLSLARQYATTKNRAVEVRFIRCQDPEMPGGGAGAQDPDQFRAIQLLEVLEGGTTVPIGKTEFLPQAIVFSSDTRSSLLDGETTSQTSRAPVASTDVELPRGIKMNYKFVSFRFLPDGATTLAANHNWFVTVLNLNDQSMSTRLPANFFITQIDPVNGITHGFRPN